MAPAAFLRRTAFPYQTGHVARTSTSRVWAQKIAAPQWVYCSRGDFCVDAGKDDPQLFDDFRVCPVGHRPPLQHLLALPEPVSDFVHEVVEPVFAGLAHDIDIGPQNP